MTILKYIKPL